MVLDGDPLAMKIDSRPSPTLILDILFKFCIYLYPHNFCKEIVKLCEDRSTAVNVTLNRNSLPKMVKIVI